MLVNISVSNFRSFKEKTTFSMKAGKSRAFTERMVNTAKTRVLKFKAIYGANSSGKSNIVLALDFMRAAVLNGVPGNASNDYCRLGEENPQKPSSFEMNVIFDNVYYTYGFEILLSEGKFLKEWLYERKGVKDNVLFDRDVKKGEYDLSFYRSSKSLFDRLCIYADDVKNDTSTLFLTIMNQNKDALYLDDSKIKIFQTLFNWFGSKLSVNFPDTPITPYSYFFNSVGCKNAEAMLSKLDTGISEVTICDEPSEKVFPRLPKEMVQDILDNLKNQKKHIDSNGSSNNPAVMLRESEGHSMYIIEMHGDDIICKTLKFKHNHSNSLFSLMDESDGTVRILDLLEVLFSEETNMVYIIDEVNRKLHPLMTKSFIKEYLAMAEKRNIQLIVTTHETIIMDLDLLRQDEIGFVKKSKQDGSSCLFNLDELGARFDKKIKNAYLKGDYGAIPEIENL